MTRRRRVENQDPDHARWVIDQAYSLGCLAALGHAEAEPTFERWVKVGTPGQITALREQFAAGKRDEKARGPAVDCTHEALQV